MKKSLCIIALDKMLSNIPVRFKEDFIKEYAKNSINVNGEFIIEAINSNETVNLTGATLIDNICITELELI